MADAYQIKDQKGMYFLMLQALGWAAIFTRTVYRDIIIESFKQCRKSKGLRICAYVIMSNYIHHNQVRE